FPYTTLFRSQGGRVERPDRFRGPGTPAPGIGTAAAKYGIGTLHCTPGRVPARGIPGVPIEIESAVAPEQGTPCRGRVLVLGAGGEHLRDTRGAPILLRGVHVCPSVERLGRIQ